MNTKPTEVPKDMPEALERIRALEAQLATARIDAVREVVGLMEVEGSDFYYNKPNDYGVITVGFVTGEGDPWEVYRGPEVQKKYIDGVRGSGRWSLNEAFVQQLMSRLDKKAARPHNDLDARMKAAGMVPLSEMLVKIPVGGFLAHTGVTDLESYESWVRKRREEMLRMLASMELDGKQEDDLYEWVVAHAAVLTEVLCNLQVAMGRSPTTIVDMPN